MNKGFSIIIIIIIIIMKETINYVKVQSRKINLTPLAV